MEKSNAMLSTPQVFPSVYDGHTVSPTGSCNSWSTGSPSPPIRPPAYGSLASRRSFASLGSDRTQRARRVSEVKATSLGNKIMGIDEPFDFMERQHDGIVLRLMRYIRDLEEENKALRKPATPASMLLLLGSSVFLSRRASLQCLQASPLCLTSNLTLPTKPRSASMSLAPTPKIAAFDSCLIHDALPAEDTRGPSLPLVFEVALDGEREREKSLKIQQHLLEENMALRREILRLRYKQLLPPAQH